MFVIHDSLVLDLMSSNNNNNDTRNIVKENFVMIMIVYCYRMIIEQKIIF